MGARGKLAATLIPPSILILDLIILFFVVKYKFDKHTSKNDDSLETSKKMWQSQMIAYQSVLTIVLSIVYIQFVYSFIRLSVCYQKPDGTSVMWYAPEWECYDIGIIHNIFIYFLF